MQTALDCIGRRGTALALEMSLSYASAVVLVVWF